MAMPSGNVGIPDKMQFPAGGGGGTGGEIHPPHHRHWFPDERDGFIFWLRGEFAAANAIIDSLCHHLRAIGEPGEYDAVIGSVQHRRCNWNPVLHMQQYFPVAEVIYALQQVGLRQDHRYYYGFKVSGKDRKRFNVQAVGSKQGHGVESFKEIHKSSTEYHNISSTPSSDYMCSKKVESVNKKCEEAKLVGETAKSDDKSVVVSEEKNGDGAEDVESARGNISDLDKEDDEGCTSNSRGSCNVPVEINSQYIPKENGKQNLASIPKTFVGTELIDKKSVNVVDGLKLYDGLEFTRLFSLVNDLRTVGRKGQFQEAGQTFVVSKRPMRGHGREMIQFGLPIAESPFEDGIAAGNSKGNKIEPIPALLQDVIERICGMHVMTAKPDSCIIDFYNEGDYSQPHMWPPWFGRPICLLLLTECDLTFGRVIVADNPGNYRGSLELSLSPGSLLVIEGKSMDIAKHAIPSLRKQRIIVTFANSQSWKFGLRDGQRLTSSVVPPPSHRGQPPSRCPNPIRHAVGPMHHAPVSTAGVLPYPAIRLQLPPPSGIRPLFVTAPVAPAMPFPAPVALPPCSTG